MKIVGLANFQTFFKKTCTNNPTSEIQIALKYSFELHQLAAEKKKLVQLKQIFGGNLDFTSRVIGACFFEKGLKVCQTKDFHF